MKVTKEKVENSQAYLTVEMDQAEVDVALDGAYKKMVKKTTIPGFRKGNAPRDVFERHVGHEALLEEAINELIPDAYSKAVQEQALEPIAQPDIELEKLEPVVFKAVVPLSPTVTLGDYKTIRMTPDEVKIEEDSVDKVITQLQHQNATWEPVEREVAEKDLLNIDVKSDIDGLPFVNKIGLQYTVEKGSGYLVPGFPEQLIGIARGEEKEFKIKLPDDYGKKEYAGKEANFKVKVNEIKQEKLPEVNDDFIKLVASDCADIKTLREKIFADLKTREEERVKNAFEEKIIQAAVDMSKIEYPPVLVKDEIDRLFNQQLQYLQYSGINVDEYLKMLKKSTDELKEDLRPRAVKRVVQSLVLDKMADEEKLEVSEQEIDAELDAFVLNYEEGQRAQVKESLKASSHESVEGGILVRKALAQLVEIAKTDNKKEEAKETKNE